MLTWPRRTLMDNSTFGGLTSRLAYLSVPATTAQPVSADKEVEKALETLASARDKVKAATQLLASSNPKIRVAIASQVTDLPLEPLACGLSLQIGSAITTRTCGSQQPRHSGS